MSVRQTRPEFRAFECFPEDSICPICGTNDQGKTVLIPIAGTQVDGRCEAQPMHLGCAVIQVWDRNFKFGCVMPEKNEEK